MEKNVLIIPDVHGRTFWKKAVESGDYAKMVFLGDYVDAYEDEGISRKEELENFIQILQLKVAHPNDVVLLLGNHDLHYYSAQFCELACGTRYSEEYADVYAQLYAEHAKDFCMAFEWEMGERKYLFSHAGVTDDWLKLNEKVIGVADAAHLNRLIGKKRGVEALAQVGWSRGGDKLAGSMVWADVDDMKGSVPQLGVYQIFGHSQQWNGPVITKTYACLDCRQAFVLTMEGLAKVNV